MADLLKGKKILVIDDEQLIVDIVKEVVKREGGTPFGVASAEKGLQMARGDDFDVIVLDRYMPDIDGHKVLKELKANPRTKKVPVIMLTAEGKKSEIQTSVDLGASGYVIKPFQPKSFCDQLRKILESQSSAKD